MTFSFGVFIVNYSMIASLIIINCHYLLIWPGCLPCTEKCKWSVCACSAKTKCRKFETNIPRKGISGSQSQFPHSYVCERIIYSHRGLSPNFHIHMSVSELYIPTMGLPFLLDEICRLILGIYKSFTDTWMWKLGLRLRNSQKRNI